MRTVWILAAVAVALGAYILLVERHRPTTDQKRANRLKLLPAFVRTEVTRLRLARAGRAPLVITKTGDGAQAWALAPDNAPADQTAVEQLLAELDFAEVDRVADTPPREAGLDPPAVLLEVESAGNHLALRLGRPDGTGQGVYVQRQKETPVLVAPRRLLALADRDADQFRDRRLFASTAQAQTIEWREGDGTRAALQTHNGRWQNDRRELVSPAWVSEALRRLGELQAELFVPAQDGLPAAPEALALTTAGGGRTVLRVRDTACPEATQVGLERSAPTAASGRTATDWLCAPADRFDEARALLSAARHRDPRLLVSNPESVTTFTLSGERKLVTLVREGVRWKFTAPTVDYEADRDAIVQWLTDLAAISTKPAGASPHTIAHPTRSLTVTSTLTEQIAIGARQGEGVWVQRQGEGAAVRAPASLLPLLDPDPLRFRARDVLSFARADAQRVRRTSPQGQDDLRKAPDQSWHLTRPSGPPVDSAALDRLLATASNLRAQRFLGPSRTFPSQQTLAITETPPGGREQTHTLELAPRTPDGCHARLDGQTTFILAPEPCADLTAPLAASSQRP